MVPLGIPMIVGPAVLTTLLTLARTHGYLLTVVGFGLNLAIVWAALRWAALIGRVLGDAGCRAITKILSLVLAAIAVTFVRRGADGRAGAVNPGNSVTFWSAARPSSVDFSPYSPLELYQRIASQAPSPAVA